MNASRRRPMLPSAHSGRRGSGVTVDSGGADCMRARPRCVRKRLKPLPICPWMLVAEIAGGMGLQLCLMSDRRRVSCSNCDSVRQRRCRQRGDMLSPAPFLCIDCGGPDGRGKHARHRANPPDCAQAKRRKAEQADFENDASETDMDDEDDHGDAERELPRVDTPPRRYALNYDNEEFVKDGRQLTAIGEKACLKCSELLSLIHI